MVYSDQRYVAELVRIQREVVLPDDALGKTLVKEGQRVDVRDKIARGVITNKHHILDAMSILKLGKPQDLEELMLVEVNTQVDEGTAIAGRDPHKGRRVLAPVAGIVTAVVDGRIVFQEMPQVVTMEAGVRGVVVRVYPDRGAAIEATGALIQGVWGNGHNVIATMRMEPSGGIENIQLNELDTTYRNEVMVTSRPLTRTALDVSEARGLAGIIAPGMDADLIPDVMALDRAVLLTEGFGNMKMTPATLTLLQSFDGQTVTLDSYYPQRWQPRRPEAVINRLSNEKPPAPDFRVPLKQGARVRVSRAPYVGQIGRVNALPEQPVLLPNGLRATCAEVTLMTGETVYIPVANLELAGT